MDRNIFLSSANFDFKNKRVLVRIDCDVDLRKEGEKLLVDEDFRLRMMVPTIEHLVRRGVSKIVLTGHLGRPGGKVVETLSLLPVSESFLSLLGLGGSPSRAQVDSFTGFTIGEKIILLENLRFNKEEEENNDDFSQKLSLLADVYINDCFGVSHRDHSSLVGIPKFLPSFLGLRFEEEIETLGHLQSLKSENRPLVFVLGGSKEDKLDYLEFLGDWCDKLLIGGKLPSLLPTPPESEKILMGSLTQNKKDIDEKTIAEFEKEIAKAGSIIWAGPMGVYEEKESEKGTVEVARSIAQSNGFKIAGGGDTHRILSRLDLWDSFDFVSIGGGAMLYFLKNKTLPGIEAVRRNNLP